MRCRVVTGDLTHLIFTYMDLPEHLSASSSWTGTETSQWQEMHLDPKQPQDQRASRQALHNGWDREGCEEELCVSGMMSPEQPYPEGTRTQHIQVWPSHAVLGSSISRLTMSSSSRAHCYARCNYGFPFKYCNRQIPTKKKGKEKEKRKEKKEVVLVNKKLILQFLTNL